MKDYFRVPSAIWDNETFVQFDDKTKLLYLLLIRLESKFGPWFYQPDVALCRSLACSSRRTVYRARDKLVSSGLIQVRRGNKGRATEYRVIEQTWWL